VGAVPEPGLGRRPASPSRYIYEHLFLAHLHFAEAADAKDPPQFYKLIRSSTPPGQPPAIIATRRPYDDPGVERPYYRLVPEREAIVAKLHLPYRLDAARMVRWTELFHDADYAVTELPSYAPEVASNPFVAFRAIPVPSRYRFMIDESEFIMMGFIKGAVCRGPIALNVIDDHYHVFFLDPDAPTRLHDAEFLYKHADVLRMPAEASSNARPLATWVRQSRREKAYAAVKLQALRDDAAAGGEIDLKMLWDGDGHNPNASLTIFRHFDSATVVKGMVGTNPKTTWVLGYPLFERIHYLLVAGFDVYGNVGHQLATRTYMDFLRMESEFAFLALLPAQVRKTERQFWYRDTRERAYREIVDELSGLNVESQIRYTSDQPKAELYGLIAGRLAPTLSGRFGLDDLPLAPDAAGALRRLGTLAGVRLQWLPQAAFLYVPDAPAGPRCSRSCATTGTRTSRRRSARRTDARRTRTRSRSCEGCSARTPTRFTWCRTRASPRSWIGSRPWAVRPTTRRCSRSSGSGARTRTSGAPAIASPRSIARVGRARPGCSTSIATRTADARRIRALRRRRGSAGRGSRRSRGRPRARRRRCRRRRRGCRG
jgi:hypothetical protein